MCGYRERGFVQVSWCFFFGLVLFLIFFCRFSNSVSDDVDERELDSITLLDFSSSAGALWMYVVGCQAYKTGDPLLSDFRGVPLVDVDEFLKCVDFDDSGSGGESGSVVMEDRVVFPFKHDIVSLGTRPIVTVFTKPVVALNLSKPAPCPDLSLVSEDSPVAKGYLVTIGTRAIPDILRVVFNASGFISQVSKDTLVRMDYASVAMARLIKRRRLSGEVASPDVDAVSEAGVEDAAV